MLRAADVARKLCPGARPDYIEAFEAGDDLLAAAGITTTRRLRHFLAQCFAETGGLEVFIEDHRYTRQNLSDAWDGGNWHKYFKSKSEMLKLAGKGEQLFNIVYGNRMGNGGPETGDGFRYRGRGMLQTTGREAYAKYGRMCGVDFEGDPDLIFAPEHALKPALAEWTAGRCNERADRDDILGISRQINIGNAAAKGTPNGMNHRRSWLARLTAVLPDSAADAGPEPAPAPWPKAAPPLATEAGPPPKAMVAAVQTALAAKGYPPGAIDGAMGSLTRGALAAFRADNGFASDTPDHIDAALIAAIEAAPMRPVSVARATATAAAITGSRIIDGAKAGQLAALGTGTLTAGKAVLDAVAPAGAPAALPAIPSVADLTTQVQGVHDLTTTTVGLLQVLGGYWWVPALALAGFALWKLRGVIAARVEDHRTGRTP